MKAHGTQRTTPLRTGSRALLYLRECQKYSPNRAAANSPVITSIRRGPGGKADWLVSIEGVCTDTHIRDRQLRNYRKFCNVIKHRFGVTFDPMPQADWLAIVEAAIAEGGASCA